MNKEEAQCAARMDAHSNVERWVRNPDRETQGGFWLPKSPGKFFPDFIVELKDGTIVLIEYKMGKISFDPRNGTSEPSENSGQRGARASADSAT